MRSGTNGTRARARESRRADTRLRMTRSRRSPIRPRLRPLALGRESRCCRGPVSAHDSRGHGAALFPHGRRSRSRISLALGEQRAGRRGTTGARAREIRASERYAAGLVTADAVYDAGEWRLMLRRTMDAGKSRSGSASRPGARSRWRFSRGTARTASRARRARSGAGTSCTSINRPRTRFT